LATIAECGRRGPTENGHRPAINALFRSVALTFGPRAVGILMSGVLDDGVLGPGAIRSRGGTTIGQSLDDALFPQLPAKARDAGVLDRQAAAAEIGEVLEQLSQREIKEPGMEPDAQTRWSRAHRGNHRVPNRFYRLWPVGWQRSRCPLVSSLIWWWIL
jgi:hypothetical protein